MNNLKPIPTSNVQFSTSPPPTIYGSQNPTIKILDVKSLAAI